MTGMDYTEDTRQNSLANYPSLYTMLAIAKAGVRISKLNRSEEIRGESMFLKELKLNNAVLCK